jgi:hypothetical protein
MPAPGESGYRPLAVWLVVVEDNAAELAKVTEALAAMQDALVRGTVSVDAWAAAVGRLEARQKALSDVKPRQADDDWKPTGQSFDEFWASLSEAEQHTFILGAGVRAYGERLRTKPGEDGKTPRMSMQSFFPRGPLDGLDLTVAKDNELHLTIHWGDLNEVRKRAARRGAAPVVPLVPQ